MEDRINEKLVILREKLNYLSESIQHDENVVKNGDVYSHSELKTRGTDKEITDIRREIAILESQLQAIRIQKRNNTHQEKTSRSIIKKEVTESELQIDGEQLKKDTFNRIKQAYKKDSHSFDKFINFILGKAPKWDKISKLSQEQLEYILRAKDGNTKTQQIIAKSMEDRKLEFKEQRQRVVDSNWRAFNRLLQSQEKLKQEMEFENIKRGTTR